MDGIQNALMTTKERNWSIKRDIERGAERERALKKDKERKRGREKEREREWKKLAFLENNIYNQM